ncbi:MAG TPA: META domain-containing protein, partial [Saprospiraceae bacterium]|nr:META domain-containing protein [Saprospiraceae bacterium]
LFVVIANLLRDKLQGSFGCNSVNFVAAGAWSPNLKKAGLFGRIAPCQQERCNDYSGTYEKSDPATLRFGPAMSTKKYCTAVADWESAYMTVLGMVDNYAIREGRLHLYAGTKQVAVFK